MSLRIHSASKLSFRQRRRVLVKVPINAVAAGIATLAFKYEDDKTFALKCSFVELWTSNASQSDFLGPPTVNTSAPMPI
jgi:hypothetical protein